MYRTIIFCSAMICFFSLANATPPTIVFDADEYGFGKIAPGTVVEHDFIYRNKGNDTLVIDNVRPTCGCTAAQPTKKRLAKGEEGKIHISFNSKGFTGNIEKSIRVMSNDPKNGTAMLRFTGTIAVEVQTSPVSIFVQQKKGEEIPPQVIEVKNLSGKPLNIIAVECSSPALTTNTPASVLPIEIAKDSRLIVTVKIDPTSLEKSWQEVGNILIKTDNKMNPEFKVPVYVEKMK